MTRILSDHMRELLRVYFIAGSNNCHKDLREVVSEAIDGGITLFQFREKGKGALTGEEKYRLAKEVQQICKSRGIPFIVNDDVEMALALDADGVHIGQDDETADSVREKIGNKILGVSVHNLEEAQRAIRQGADYFGVGPVFPTQSKEDAQQAKGTTVIEAIRKNGIDMPIVGIGGISVDNASIVMRGGADGVSVISAISQAASVSESAKELRAAILEKE
ncbi:thiamine phosphate synthase [Ectobacillus panaciterrae]|uniref:thiamine phosphate synthase n=1 Tax=Ectobacillus panaciterrae TaxID=363872 RepID=UPI0003F85617|nr:thiamine phosphate synthase [Ectobacillus panaciterrae]